MAAPASQQQQQHHHHHLPDARTLAALVSKVTDTMCGTSFVPAGDPLARGESLCGTMVLLPLLGERNISIVLACDARAGRALACSLLGSAANQITPDLVDEAVRELLNMIAGQVTAAMHIDQVLGLPRRTTLAEITLEGGLGMDDTVLLSSHGRIDLRLWIFERSPPPAAPAATAGPVPEAKPHERRRSWLRSLLRRD
jgi:hypothetical protein